MTDKKSFGIELDEETVDRIKKRYHFDGDARVRQFLQKVVDTTLPILMEKKEDVATRTLGRH